MDFPNLDQLFSTTSAPVPPDSFCAFCLHTSSSSVEFYKHIAGCSHQQQQSFQKLLGYEFKLQSFSICKLCWNLLLLMQEFRWRCQKASRLTEQIGQGLGSEEDDWFSEKIIATVENIRMVLQDQVRQFELMEEAEVPKVKVTTSEDDVESTELVGEIKIEPIEVDVEECKEAMTVEDRRGKSPETKPVLAVEEDQTSDESNPSDEEQSESEEDGSEEKSLIRKLRSGLLRCKKCKRTFDKMRSIRLHLNNCDGQKPAGILTCPVCRATFMERRLLQTHMNKHDGKTPFKCRKGCEKPFVSAQIRNRHELTCYQDVRQCALCGEELVNQMRLNDHYRIVHPGEPRYPCPECDKKFKRRDQFESHFRRIHSDTREKIHPCPICGKKFAELLDMKGHQKIHEKRGQQGKGLPCRFCDKRLWNNHSLAIHVGGVHAELASEADRQAYARKRQQAAASRAKIAGIKSEEK